MFKKDHHEDAARRMAEQQLYDRLAEELRLNQRHSGIWLRALQKAEGCEESAKAFYVEYRIQFFKDELLITEQAAAEEKRRNQDQEDLNASYQENLKREERWRESKNNIPRKEGNSKEIIFIFVTVLLGVIVVGLYHAGR